MHLFHSSAALSLDSAESTTAARTSTSTPRTSARRPLQRIAGAAAAAALTLLGLSLGTSPALAHDQLTSQGVVVETSDGSVTGVKLSFNNEIIEVGAEIAVTAPDGSSANDGIPVVSGRDVTQGITRPTQEGDYSIDWRVVSSDGHPIQGKMTLSIDAAGVGSLSVAEAEHAHDEESEEATASSEDADHDATEHEHGDDSSEHAVTTSEDSDGQNPLMTTLIVVGIVLVAGGAAAAVLVGGKRRRDAMNEAIEEAKQNTTDQ